MLLFLVGLENFKYIYMYILKIRDLIQFTWQITLHFCAVTIFNVYRMCDDDTCLVLYLDMITNLWTAPKHL